MCILKTILFFKMTQLYPLQITRMFSTCRPTSMVMENAIKISADVQMLHEQWFVTLRRLVIKCAIFIVWWINEKQSTQECLVVPGDSKHCHSTQYWQLRRWCLPKHQRNPPLLSALFWRPQKNAFLNVDEAESGCYQNTTHRHTPLDALFITHPLSSALSNKLKRDYQSNGSS